MRFQAEGDLHFVTFSCYERRAYLTDAANRDCFVKLLERSRVRFGFAVAGYAVMPNHVHLMLSEPQEGNLADALHSLKLSVAKTLAPRPFWQKRYYDFNVYSRDKAVEKHEVHAPQSGEGWAC